MAWSSDPFDEDLKRIKETLEGLNNWLCVIASTSLLFICFESVNVFIYVMYSFFAQALFQCIYLCNNILVSVYHVIVIKVKRMSY